MEQALRRGGYPDFTIRVMPGADHLGLVASPDRRIVVCTHFVPEYLQAMADWVLERVGGRRRR